MSDKKKNLEKSDGKQREIRVGFRAKTDTTGHPVKSVIRDLG